MTVTLERVQLPGEPNTDRAYRVAETGRVWRLRVIEREIASTVAGVMNGGEPLFREFALQMSAALLDPECSVAKDPAGRLIIMEIETYTVPLAALQNPAFNPDALVAEAILTVIERAEQWCNNINTAGSFLARWKAGAPAGPEVVNG